MPYEPKTPQELVGSAEAAAMRAITEGVAYETLTREQLEEIMANFHDYVISVGPHRVYAPGRALHDLALSLRMRPRREWRQFMFPYTKEEMDEWWEGIRESLGSA